MAEPLERRDLHALGATRAELGHEYEPALLDAFADRVEAVVESRVAEAVRTAQPDPGLDRRLAGQQLALAIVSLVAAIPISVVAAVKGELLAMVVAWIGIVAVNAAHASLGRRRR